MSTILVDNLTGKTSAGSITVTSEGGAATQSLQQGLIKVWASIKGTGTVSTRDSVNQSSVTDHGTGAYSSNFTSAMSNDDFVGSISNTLDDGVNSNGQSSCIENNSTDPEFTTTTARVVTENTAYNNNDSPYVGITVIGDLA
jgi:hypothetical protein